MSNEMERISGRILTLNLDRPARVSVDGFCGAGKTTFADHLAKVLSNSNRPVIRVSADNFQNPPEIRWQLGKNTPEGFYLHAIDLQSLRDQLLESLNDSDNCCYRTSTYGIRNMKPDYSPQFVAEPGSILIVDGLFLFKPELRSYWDYSIFVDVPFETCITRARRRNQEMLEDADAVETQYRQRYVPGYQLYLDQINPKQLADIVVDGEKHELQ